MFSRLVSTGEVPTILWMDGVGLAGNQSPGLLGLGLMRDAEKLKERALRKITDSFAHFLSKRNAASIVRARHRRSRPKISFRSPPIDPQTNPRVAVVPLYNESLRKNAGQIMALHLVRRLVASDRYRVLEPGRVRGALLEYRMIMKEGISLDQAETIFEKLNVELAVTGKVIDYQDPMGEAGYPKVDFSLQWMDGKRDEIVGASKSYATGKDGIFLFDWGNSSTAHEMASEMSRSAIRLML